MSLPNGRTSGILLPLFSFRSQHDAGIGDFGCFEGVFRWMQAAKQQLLMILPLLPTAPNDPSPYATRSACGFNPLYIDLSQLPGALDFTPEETESLKAARSASTVQYQRVFPLKAAALERAFRRAQVYGPWDGFDRFMEDQREWLKPFSLFSALSELFQFRPWWEWPEPLRNRDAKALEQAHFEHSERVRFHAWLQWVADTQWKKVREKAKAYGVQLVGDEPFIIGNDSVDAWAFPHLLRRDGRLGVPPDDFSADGQDWGLPWFDFEAMEREGYRWLKYRSHWAAQTFDLRRVDHAIGYFRQYVRDEQSPQGRFIPDGADRQKHFGERHFRMLSEGTGIVAEDLGVMTPFVRSTLEHLKIPGYRVMRWSRHDGQYQNPQQYPDVSLVTTGTHDTESLKEWWNTSQPWEREAVCRSFPELNRFSTPPVWNEELHHALLRAAQNASSNLCIIPWGDVFAEVERVNLPGSMGTHNWTYRMRPQVEELMSDKQTVEAAQILADMTRAAGRFDHSR